MNAERSNEIVRENQQHLLQVVRRNLPARLWRLLDPDDLVQSVFRSFFRRRVQGELADETIDDLTKLLVTMTLNKVRNAIQHHQRQRRDVRRDMIVHGDTPDISKFCGQDWNIEHDLYLAELVDKIMAGLPDVQREIILLRMAGRSVSEISNQVSRSERTVLRVLKSAEQFAKEELH